MTLNEALVKQLFINKILLKNENKELSKKLKVKIMNMRILLGKVKVKFNSECKDFVDSLKSEEFEELNNKENRTEKEETLLKELINKINNDYNAFITEKGNEEVLEDTKFTEEEYNQIIQVNADNDIVIEDSKLSASDFLEVIHTLFVE